MPTGQVSAPDSLDKGQSCDENVITDGTQGRDVTLTNFGELR